MSAIVQTVGGIGAAFFQKAAEWAISLQGNNREMKELGRLFFAHRRFSGSAKLNWEGGSYRYRLSPADRGSIPAGRVREVWVT